MRSTNELRHALCDKIQARIETLSLTQAQAAERAGTTQSVISEIKNHKSEYGIDGLVSILTRLGVSVEIRIKGTVND